MGAKRSSGRPGTDERFAFCRSTGFSLFTPVSHGGSSRSGSATLQNSLKAVLLRYPAIQSSLSRPRINGPSMMMTVATMISTAGNNIFTAASPAIVSAR